MTELELKIKRKLVLFCLESGVVRNEWAKGAGISKEAVRRYLSFRHDRVVPLFALGWLRKEYGLDVNKLLDQGAEQ